MSEPIPDPYSPAPGDRAYRVFELDNQGYVASTEIILAASDEKAKDVAQTLSNRHGLELWERARRLARYPHYTVGR